MKRKNTYFLERFTGCSALIQHLATSPDFDITLFFTPPSVPFKGIEKYLTGVSSINKILHVSDLPDHRYVSSFDSVVTTGCIHAIGIS